MRGFSFSRKTARRRATSIGGRTGRRLPRRQPRGADMRGAVAAQANFRHAKLGHADLSCSDLRRADLREARPTQANLDGAGFDGRTRWPAGMTAQRAKHRGWSPATSSRSPRICMNWRRAVRTKAVVGRDSGCAPQPPHSSSSFASPGYAWSADVGVVRSRCLAAFRLRTPGRLVIRFVRVASIPCTRSSTGRQQPHHRA